MLYFTFRSYRNPNQAEIIANFPSPEPRPRTVIGSTNNRAHVPSPYFFKSYNPPKTPGTRYTSVYASQVPTYEGRSTIMLPHNTTVLHKINHCMIVLLFLLSNTISENGFFNQNLQKKNNLISEISCIQ